MCRVVSFYLGWFYSDLALVSSIAKIPYRNHLRSSLEDRTVSIILLYAEGFGGDALRLSKDRRVSEIISILTTLATAINNTYGGILLILTKIDATLEG
jgi:hypothetical protein